MKTYFAFILTASLWFVQSVESKEPSMIVYLEGYEKCMEGKTNIEFGNISLDHGAKKKVSLTYDFTMKREIKAPVQLEAIISAKAKKDGDYQHQFSPKKDDFCPSLDDKDDLFTQILHAIGLKKMACPIEAKKYKIKNQKFVMPKKAGDSLFSHEYWNVTTIFRTEGNEDSEMCLILYLRTEKEEKERDRNFNKEEKKDDEEKDDKKEE